MAGMLSTLAEFERDIISEGVKAGIANARAHGRPHGPPRTAALKTEIIRSLKRDGLNSTKPEDQSRRCYFNVEVDLKQKLALSARRLAYGILRERYCGPIEARTPSIQVRPKILERAFRMLHRASFRLHQICSPLEGN